ncbi:IS3 family transposase [Aliarcobacter thereius]
MQKVFFHSLKTELIHHEKFVSRKQANEKIFEYIKMFIIDKDLLKISNEF